MAMLIGWRRYFAVIAFLVLATPLVVGLVRPDSPAAILKEGRSLAPAPRMPGSSAGWLALPEAGRRLSARPFRVERGADHGASGADQTDARLRQRFRCWSGATGASSILATTRCVRAPAFSSATGGWPTLSTCSQP